MLVCQAKELVWVVWHETVQSPAPVLSLHWQRNAQGGRRECSRDGCPSFSRGSLRDKIRCSDQVQNQLQSTSGLQWHWGNFIKILPSPELLCGLHQALKRYGWDLPHLALGSVSAEGYSSGKSPVLERHRLSVDPLPCVRSVLWDETKHVLELPVALHQAACGDWLGRGLNLPEGGQFRGVT